MAKYKLEEKSAAPLEVFAISCHVPDYRLCWSLNRGLGLELTRRREDIVEQVRGKELHYTVFQQADVDKVVRWSLVCNTCGKRRLVPSQKQADYFLLVDREADNQQTALTERLRQCEFVLTAFPLDLDTIKSGDKLLLCLPDERTEDQDRRHHRPGQQLA